MKPKDYYLLLMSHMDTSDAARSSLRSIQKDYRALGAAVMDPEAQVKEVGIERASQIWQIKMAAGLVLKTGSAT